MKAILYTPIVLLIASCITNRSNAEVFERDWQTPGDGLLTFDDVNQREWLDLSVSRLDQFPEPRLENAIAEIAPGGLFDGFTWATSPDVIGLAHSAGIDTTTLVYSTNHAATAQVINLLSITLQTSQSVHSVGFLNELDPAVRQVGAGFFVNPTTGGTGLAGLQISGGLDFLREPSTGVMLYRVIPEPSTLVLTLLLISYVFCPGRVE